MYCLQLRLTHYSEGNFALHVTALSAAAVSRSKYMAYTMNMNMRAAVLLACVFEMDVFGD
jgi:hypothetical protein